MPARPTRGTVTVTLELPADLVARVRSHLAPHRNCTLKGMVAEMLERGLAVGHVPAPTPRTGRPPKERGASRSHPADAEPR